MNAPEEDPIKAMFARSQQQTADLAKVYLRDKGNTGRLVTKVRSRSILALWIGAVIFAAFICFTLANTIGKTLLGLEENLEHHREYLEAGSALPKDKSTADDGQEPAAVSGEAPVNE